MKNSWHNSGFTFIEVLVAMLIFVLAALTAVDLVRGAVRSTGNTKEITVATWLLQNVMTELETKLETVGLEEGCEKEVSGKFEAPHENYTWNAYCYEIDIQLSETAAQVMAAQGTDEEQSNTTSENPILKTVFNMANEYIGKSLRELHAEVTWTHGKQTRSVAATTHVVRLNESVAFPGL